MALRKPAGYRSFFKAGIASRSVNPDHSWQGYISARTPAPRREPYSLEDLYDIFFGCNAVRRSIQTLVDYSLKEGWEWEPHYSRRCLNCKEEYPPDDVPKHCEECGAETIYTARGEEIPWFEEPSKALTKVLDRRFKEVSVNGHSLFETLRMAMIHANVCDDGFIIVHQDYQKFDEAGKPIKWQVAEITVPDPRNFRMLIDPVTRMPGDDRSWVCHLHRPNYKHDPSTGRIVSRGQPEIQPGFCKVEGCGLPLEKAWFVSTETGNRDSIVAYYLQREVIHFSQYSPDYGHGFSQLASVYNESRLLMRMIEYMKTFYDEERVPRLLITWATESPDQIRALMEEAENRNVSQDGHYPMQIAFPPSAHGGANPVQIHELSKLPQEMQFLDVHDYCYRRIGSAFGIAPVFHGNVDAIGLQSQGPTQWAVTTLAAAMQQRVINEKVFPRILDLFGVKDYNLKLKEPEEKDELAKGQLELMELQKALLKQQLGFRVKGMRDDGVVEFDSEPTPQGGPGGPGMPGMPGMGGGGPEGLP